MAAACHQQRVANPDHLRQRIMRVRRQDDVNALDPSGKLVVDAKPVMREQDDQRSALLPCLDDGGLQVFLAYAETPVGNQPAGDAECGEGKRLADNSNLDAAAFDHGIGVEDRILPFIVAHVLGEERTAQCLHQFLDAGFAMREFPVAGHRVGLQQLEAFHHVLPARAVGGQ